MREVLMQLAELFGCDISEFAGGTLRDLFTQAELSGATVYWGFWSDSELDRPLQYPEV